MVQRQTSRNNNLESNRRVVFKREVLVANPKNRFENSRFGIELEDERGAGESYATVYKRLATQGNQLLAEQIFEMQVGRHRFDEDHAFHEIRKQYGL